MNGFGWYDNKFDDFVSAGDLNGGQKYVNWLSKNSLPVAETKNYHTLYCDPSLFKKSLFPILLAYAYARNIRFGLAFSAVSEIKEMLTYNSKQKDDTTRLRFAVTELEPYNTGQYLEMTNTLKEVSSLITPIPLCVYMGRPDAAYWKTIFKYVDRIKLHCYLKDYSPSKIKNYLEERFTQMSKAAVELKKNIVVDIIFSNEPKNPKTGEEFGYKYFLSMPWGIVWDNFNTAYPSDITGIIKPNLYKGGLTGFNTKYATQIKP